VEPNKYNKLGIFTANMQIWCILLPDGVPVKVDLDPETYVFTLMKEFGLLESINRLHCLSAWKLIDPEPFIPIEDFALRLKARGEIETFATPVSSVDQISEVFPQPPVEQHLHIIFKLPDPLLSKPSLSSVTKAAIMNAKLVTATVSFFTPSNMIDLQNDPGERVINDRPTCDYEWAPIELYYPNFGVFREIFVERQMPTSLHDFIDSRQFEAAVDSYRVALSHLYTDDDAKRDATLPLLQKIYLSRKGCPYMPIMTASDVSRMRMSDGHCYGSHGAIYNIQEIRAEIGSPGAVADMQSAACIARSHAKVYDQHRRMYEGWRVPSMTMIVQGN
jgi:hypothetical protein